MPGEAIRRATVRLLIVAVIASGFLLEVGAEPADAARYRSERRMVQLINKARVARGLPKLRIDRAMSNRARVHSARMARRRTIWHSPLRRTMSGLQWRIVGENVGMGPGVPRLHRAFMRSRGHRANVLHGRYRRVGVGIRWRNGVSYVTVLFAA